MNRPVLIAGNWKLNPILADGQRLIGELRAGLRERELGSRELGTTEVAVFPPYPYLGMEAVSGLRDVGMTIGAQDLATENWGAYTGAVGGALLAEFGVHYVLVGHSERRHVFGETDENCRAKVAAARVAGLVPVLCVGETEAERDRQETFDVVGRQLSRGLEGLPGGHPVVVAYEPVWAIGTGRTATQQQAAEVHRYLRGRLAELLGNEVAVGVRILYGGSVKPGNAAELLADDDIDGALVGGASLEADAFLAIVDASRD